MVSLGITGLVHSNDICGIYNLKVALINIFVKKTSIKYSHKDDAMPDQQSKNLV